MKIKCVVITQPIRDLAKSLKESETYMCNAVSTWQTENNSSRVPSLEEMKAFMADKEKEKQDLYLAIPFYKTEPFSANKPLASTSASNEITLRLLPENNPKEHFFNYITGNLNSESAKQKKAVFEALEKEGYTLEELKKILPTNKSIYSFLLWHEMSHIQNTDRETYWKNGKDLLTEDKIAIEIRATKEAWDKARKAYKMNPVKASEKIQQQSIQQEVQKVKETHDTLINDLGGGEQAAIEVQDAVKVAKKGMSFKEALAGQEAFFSKEEQTQIKQGLNGKNLQVMSVSRLTDPAFFSEEIVSFLKKNAEKPLNDQTRVTAIEIWSKHDGLPIKDILDACKKYRVAPMVSFSITGLGGTALEEGVMKYQDMLEKVGKLIKNGTLNPTTTTIRIDPILPGVTSMDDIKKIVKTAKSYGIKKFVTSLVQSYGYTEGTPKDRKVISGINNALASEGKSYDWDKYYGRDSRGKINFKPKQEVIDEIGKVLLELDKDPEITIQTCAFGIKGLKVSACLDPMIIERITGVDVLRKDGTYDRDTSRPECMCYGCHGDFFKGKNKKCYSSCAYCYAAHSGDNKLNYYNEDGTLKDNNYTRTERVQQSLPGPETKINIYAGTGENADLSNFADRPFVIPEDFSVSVPSRRDISYGTIGINNDDGSTTKYRSVEAAFQGIKATYSETNYPKNTDFEALRKQGKALRREDFANMSGTEAKRNERNITDLDRQDWDKDSSIIMKALLKLSFQQNPQARQRLFETGSATLTHTQDKGKWGTEFPKLLMEVRDELLKEYHYDKSVQAELDFGESVKPNTSNTEEDLTAIQAQVPNTSVDLSKLKKLEDTEEAAAQKEDSVEDLPEIGVEPVSLNKENERTKCAREFDSKERQDRIEMIARDMWESIKEAKEELIQNYTQALNEELNKETPDKTEINRLKEKIKAFNNDDYKAIVDTLTPTELFNRVKIKYEEWAKEEGLPVDMVAKINKVLNNWDVLVSDACPIFKKYTDVTIVPMKVNYNDGNNSKKKISGSTDDSAEKQRSSDSNQDDSEGENIKGDSGWGYQVRYIHPHETLSKEVKSFFMTIPKTDKNGKKERDDLGNTKYLDEEYVHAVLVAELADIISPDDFSVEKEEKTDGTKVYAFPALEKLKSKYPWVSQIMLKLQTNPRLISAMYSDLRQDFIPMWKYYYDDKEDKIKILRLNQKINWEKPLQRIVDTYIRGEKLDEDSLYNEQGVPNKENAKKSQQLINEIVNLSKNFFMSAVDASAKKEYINEVSSRLLKACHMAGVDIDPYQVKQLIEEDITAVVGGSKTKSSFEFLLDSLSGISSLITTKRDLENMNLVDSAGGYYTSIAKTIGTVQELDRMSSLREGDKQRCSYSAPNYINTLIKQLSNTDLKERTRFIEDKFGRDPWFRNQTTGKWYNEWLRLLTSSDPNDLEIVEHLEQQELIDINGANYKSWTPAQIKEAFIMNFFNGDTSSTSKNEYGWFNFPIFADSPVAQFIKFRTFSKDECINLLANVVEQEIYRIERVKQRRDAGVPKIKNYDDNGLKFNFFPELNSYIVEGGATFLDDIKIKVDNDDLDGVRKACRKAISDIMESKFKTFSEENFSADTKEFIAKQLANTYKYAYKKGAKLDDKNDKEFTKALEHYFYNQAFATTQIIQLTTGDLAFYKDETDFQKRYKEVYAAGRKLNTNSKYGRKVEKTIYLTDVIKTSTSYDTIKSILDTAVKKGNIKPFDRDNILYKFRNVNAVDAQAFRSISSYRALLDMAGLWTDEMQNALDKFDPKEGGSAQSWDISDFDVIWQTIKPFVYSMTEHPNGLGGTMLVPNQNKNSEFLLLATLNMIATTMGHSSYFRALNKFMEDNEVDVIQYESTVKAGAQDTVDLSYSKPKLEKWNREHPEEVKKIEKAVRASIKQKLVKDNLKEEELANKVDEKISELSDIEKFRIGNDYLLHKQELSQSNYNKRMSDIEPNEDQIIGILNSKTKIQKSDAEDAKNGMYGWKEDAEGNRVPRGIGDFKATVVREIPYADYIIQQPTPEHLLDTTAVFGSQFRNLIIADLPEDFEITIRGKKYNKQETIKLYQSLVVENLLEDFETVKGEFENIEKLQEALLDLVKSGSYGTDIIEALQLVEVTDPKTNKTTKEFNIPLDNPTTTLKIQQLVNSLIKNKIGKQSIKGGACILASSIGFTDELHIEYNKDKGIKGFQCYMPAYSKKFYEPFMIKKYDDKGKVYYELDINKMPKELRQAVGYRIPTEDKYSMTPLIIKGFLPQQNGSAIMLPMELTQIAGSDFDVDKLFLMLPEFRVLDYNKKQARKDFANNNQIFKEAIKELSDTELGEDLLSKDTKDFDTWWEEHKEEYRFETPVVEKINYNVNKKPEEQKRAHRNNMLIDLSLAILGHPDTAEKILNPGSFDNLKLISNAASIINDSNLIFKFAEKYGLVSRDQEGIKKVNVEGVSKKLIDLIEDQDADAIERFLKDNRKVRSQLTVDTFIYNHVQNMTGKKLVAIFANNTSMQAKYQNTSLSLSRPSSYKINGRSINSLHDITSELGERISKNCASFSNAAVDNVKDPVLAKLMQNEQVAYITGFMLRAGLSVNEIGLLFNQPIIKECIEKDGNLENLEDFYKDWINKYPSDSTTKIIKDITNEDLTKAIITKSLNKIVDDANYEEELYHYKGVQVATANFILDIKDAATQMNNLTSISRADSPNGAIGHSIARAQNQVRKVELFKLKKENDLLNISIKDDELVQKDYLKPSMSKDQMREKLLQHKVPMLQAFYSLGIDLGVQMTAPYFSQTSKCLNNLREILYRYSPKGIISDDILTTFYSEAIEWALSKTKLFGNDGKRTYYEKRDYYLYQFPKEFADLLSKKPDYMQLSIFKKMEVRDGVIRMQGTGSYSETTKEELMRDFDSLLYDEKNPKAQELAVRLLCYSYYKEGFRFGPTSFGKYFSSIFLSNFPEINNAIRDIKNNSENTEYFGDYLSQFYANHYSEKDLLPHRRSKNEFTGESMNIDTNKYRNNLLDEPWDRFVLETPNGKNIFMVLDKLDANKKGTYTPAVVFSEGQKGNRGVFYNGNSTTAEMSEVKTKPSLIEANKKINPTKKFNNLVDYNDIDSKLQNVGERQLEQVDQLTSDNSEEYLNGAEEFLGKPAPEISDKEKYNTEGGQNTLEQRLC